jgi:hypothetical protein
MSPKLSERYPVLAISLTVACILQIIGTMRYIGRLPDDTFGVVLYIITCILYAVLATVHYFRWIRCSILHNSGGRS